MRSNNNRQPSIPPKRTATVQIVPDSSARLKSSFPGWILLPLRLFLGVTFLYAGIQKFMDPQFFHPGASGYIGIQLAGFAHGSPLHAFLLNIAVPHAMLLGFMVALGEIAIGLGTLIGLLLRPASFFGLLLSTTFFLTASWRVYPYFFGADIVFMFCWLTLLLSGPLFTGYPAFDTWLIRRWALGRPLDQLSIVQQIIVLAFLGGPMVEVQSDPTVYNEEQQSQGNAKGYRNSSRGWRERQQAQMVRRSFIKGTLMGGAGVLAVVAIGWILNIFGGNSGNATTSTSTTSTGESSSSTTTPASTTQSTGGPSSSAIAQVDAVPKNSATTFTLPSNGDPGVLIHLSNNQFVAFDATCTHAGCPVNYDASSQHLICPCHGAEYDPAQQAAVIQGPTNTPLTAVPIHVDNATGSITLQ